jgi:protein-tyrosine phosphatase
MRRRTVLFLCTGNYYRSRFAELLFNHLAASQKEVGWLAVSRGLAIELGARNEGPISPAAVEGLVKRGIPVDEEFHYPMELEENDLAVADHIVAVKRDEHLTMLNHRFPGWAERVEFWRVHDVDLTPPDEALAEIEQNVRRLIDRLRNSKETAHKLT